MLAAALTVPAVVAAAGTAASRPAAAAKGSVVAMSDGPFGPMLVAGSGPSAGTALYTITADYPGHIGCTTKVVKLLGGQKLACTGPIGKSTTEWPAYLTSAAPIAGPGVTKSLLGEVKIKGLGEQVTYNGHPLYLFDSLPGVLTGVNWDEPNLPPWHGNWYLVTPAGSFLPRPAIFSTLTLDSKTVLAAYMEAAGGFVLYPVYSYSAGSGCTGLCARAFPPVIGEGTPGATGGVTSGSFGTIALSDGTTQITYGGQPLYFDSHEAITIGATGLVAVGSGNDAHAPHPFSGTFSFVTP